VLREPEYFVDNDMVTLEFKIDIETFKVGDYCDQEHVSQLQAPSTVV